MKKTTNTVNASQIEKRQQIVPLKDSCSVLDKGICLFKDPRTT